jgi:hypothetical protein
MRSSSMNRLHIWNEMTIRDAETLQDDPECDAELGGGAHQSEECVAAATSIDATGATTDLSLGDMEADVTLGAMVWSGISIRSSTRSNSGLFACGSELPRPPASRGLMAPNIQRETDQPAPVGVALIPLFVTLRRNAAMLFRTPRKPRSDRP